MTCRWHSIAALLLTASTVLAGWDGFPCPSNVSWYSVETNHYWAQLMTGLVERCKAAGVAAPAIVDTYCGLFAGYTNTFTSTNGYVVTNNFICYTNITVTNQFLPFAYSWSQTNGTSGTATCYPAIKQSWIAAWDSKFASVIGSFVDQYECGLDSNSTANAYFATTNTRTSFPMWTFTNICARYGIGSSSNGGRFTRSPALLTNEWTLGAVRKTTNNTTSWSYQEMTPITTNIYDQSIRPVFEYWPSCPTDQTLATSFGGSSVVFTITGTILDFTSQTATNGTEVISITDSNDVATVHPWFRITGIACSNQPPNSNDAWRVVYKTVFPIYGSAPVVMHPDIINERMIAISGLTYTAYSYQKYTGLYYKAQQSVTAQGDWWWDILQDLAVTNIYEYHDGLTMFGNGKYLNRPAVPSRTFRTVNILASGGASVYPVLPSSITNESLCGQLYHRLTAFDFGGSEVSPGNQYYVYNNFGYNTDVTPFVFYMWQDGAITSEGGSFVSDYGASGVFGSTDTNNAHSVWADTNNMLRIELPPGLAWRLYCTVGYGWGLGNRWYLVNHTNWMTKW